MKKREDYISWDEYFMGIAKLSEKRSKDPVTQVGACIVDSNNRIVSIGYNGMPNNICDDSVPWGKGNSSEVDNKYFYVCHAEVNAIMNNRGINLNNCTIYVSLFPCNECAKIIIQSGIIKVIYADDKYANLESTIVAKKMFDLAGVTYTPFEKRNISISLNI